MLVRVTKDDQRRISEYAIQDKYEKQIKEFLYNIFEKSERDLNRKSRKNGKKFVQRVSLKKEFQDWPLLQNKIINRLDTK